MIFKNRTGMKYAPIVMLLCSVVVWTACSDRREAGSDRKKAHIEFRDTLIDYGVIDFSSDGTCEFRFINTGKGQLLMKNVKSTCGCTVPQWPREPVSPGDTASILVSYDTYRVGSFSKSIYVYSNAMNSPNRLVIKGRVRPAEDMIN